MMLIKKIICIFGLCCLIACTESKAVTESVQNSDKTIIIPHGNTNDLLVDIYIGSKGPYKFILDTGADVSGVSRTVADQLDLEFQNQTEFSFKTVSNIEYFDITTSLDLFISKDKIHRKTRLIILDNYFSEDLTLVQGVIGATEFLGGVLENEPDKARVLLTLPDKSPTCDFTNPSSDCGRIKDIDFSIPFSLGDQNGTLLIDSGYDGAKAIALYKSEGLNKIWNKYHLNLPDFTDQYTSNKPMKTLRTRDFTINNKEGCIGEFLLRDPTDSSPTTEQSRGLIGWPALKTVPFTIDYKSFGADFPQGLCVNENQKTIGIVSGYSPEDFSSFILTNIREDSPADRAGVKVGDEVEKMKLSNGHVLTKFDKTMFDWNHAHVYAPVGSQVTYYIRRDGVLKEFVMTAEDVDLLEFE